MANILTKIPKFRRCVLQNFPFIEQDFDALTDYQLLCKVVEYLNKVINSQNQVIEITEELTAAFNELQSFVENYFDNLDVQEEINNKLDAMVEAGTLQEIITTYIQANVAWTFDTVAEMKTATNLVDGSYARTLGFHSLNDGGGSLYKISNTGTANEMDVIAVGSLFANLIIPNQLNVKQTGAYGDNTHDDTATIQRSLNLNSNVFIPNGTYLVDATVSLNINTNQNIALDNNAIIQAIPNDQTNYSVVNIDNVSNVNIRGGCIKGDRNSHIGTSGEWGMCLSIINGSSNVVVEDVKLSEAWGDGLYINGASNVTTRDLKISDNRRNGTSIISVDGYISENDEIKDISGTAPEAGVDIEPNANTDIIKNISFNDLRTSNTKIGIDLSLGNLDATSSPVSIEINNSSDHNSPEGIRIGKSESVIGYVSINSPKLIENTNNAIQFRNARYNSNFVITVNNPYIYRTIVTDNQTQYSAIAIIGQYASGNITIKNPDIHQAQVSGSNIYDFRCNSSVNSDHIRVIDVLHHDKAFSVQTIDHMTIADGCNAFESITQSGAGTVGSYEYRSRSVRNAPSSTGDGTVTISASMPVGLTIEFVNLSQGHYKIQLPADTYCRAYSSSAAPLISIGAGGSLTLTRLNSTDFIAIGSVGTITA